MNYLEGHFLYYMQHPDRDADDRNAYAIYKIMNDLSDDMGEEIWEWYVGLDNDIKYPINDNIILGNN